MQVIVTLLREREREINPCLTGAEKGHSRFVGREKKKKQRKTKGIIKERKKRRSRGENNDKREWIGSLMTRIRVKSARYEETREGKG